MHYDCLIVDDEELSSQCVSKYFNASKVHTAWAANAEDCMLFVQKHTVGLILLDINLGTSSGFDLCRQLRETVSVPILFLSARQSDEDMLLALSIGGDDYIRKPYSLPVLLAKVQAVLRRYCPAAAVPAGPGGLSINRERHLVTLDGRKIDLTLMEFKLLCYLEQHQGQVIGKEDLLQKVWEDPFAGDNTLTVHIRRLREKLEEDPNNPKLIRTVRGCGYVFDRDWLFETD
ncbi:MAG: response regulator transcription factor [Gracilibacteraceae bacterium]|nr:response regulator transcription factor [Gracilibacteraceae bacterium]